MFFPFLSSSSLRRAALAALGAALCTALCAGLAAPALAQIITVPLDPIDPGEVEPGTIQQPPLPGEPLGPGAFFPGGTGDQTSGADLLPPEPRAPGSIVGEDVMTVEEDVVATGTGAILKGLDMLAGTVQDMRLANGETAALGWLQVTLGECRYPVDNPAGEAYAWIVVHDKPGEEAIFQGWMVASSPALDALDHPRFDVWVTHCTTD